MGFLKTAKYCVLPMCIVVLFIGVFIIFSYVSIKNQKEITQITDNTRTLIKLTELKSKHIGSYMCVSGIGTNISTTTLGYVRVFIAFLDKNNETVDFGGGDVLSAKKIIRPDEGFSFTRCVDDAKLEIDEKNYKLFFEGKIGTNYQSKELHYTK